MALIEVDPGELSAASGALNNAMDVIAQIKATHDSLGVSSSVVGCAEAVGAIESFLHTWSYGLKNLMHDVQTLSEMLSGAASAYAQTEQAIARGASGG